MTVQGGSHAGKSPTVQSYTFKQFFAFPDPAVISSRQLDVSGRRCATWAVAEKTPDVRNGDLVAKYGQKFIWSPLHQTLKELEPMREIGVCVFDRESMCVFMCVLLGGWIVSFPKK